MKSTLILTALLTFAGNMSARADGRHALAQAPTSQSVPATVTASANRYEHQHTGSSEQKINTDVDFGVPANWGSTDRTVKFAMASPDSVSPRLLAVTARERIGFDLSNAGTQPIAFVLGDEHTIREFAAAYGANPDSVKGDFHSVLLTAGQSQRFAWKFDTYGQQRVYAAYVMADGSYKNQLLEIQVTRDRNR